MSLMVLLDGPGGAGIEPGEQRSSVRSSVTCADCPACAARPLVAP